MAARAPLSRTLDDGKDEAITELAHVARCLMKALKEAGLPGVFDQAISNKIEYYAGWAEK